MRSRIRNGENSPDLGLSSSSYEPLHASTPPPTHDIYSRLPLKRNVTPVMAFDSSICHLSLEDEAKKAREEGGVDDAG